MGSLSKTARDGNLQALRVSQLQHCQMSQQNPWSHHSQIGGPDYHSGAKQQVATGGQDRLGRALDTVETGGAWDGLCLGMYLLTHHSCTRTSTPAFGGKADGLEVRSLLCASCCLVSGSKWRQQAPYCSPLGEGGAASESDRLSYGTGWQGMPGCGVAYLLLSRYS